MDGIGVSGSSRLLDTRVPATVVGREHCRGVVAEVPDPYFSKKKQPSPRVCLCHFCLCLCLCLCLRYCLCHRLCVFVCLCSSLTEQSTANASVSRPFPISQRGDSGRRQRLERMMKGGTMEMPSIVLHLAPENKRTAAMLTFGREPLVHIVPRSFRREKQRR